MAQTAQIDKTMIKEIDTFIDALPSKENALIQVLHKAQDIIGYIPEEVQAHIAKKLNIPSSRVYGVVTFYSYLKMEPRGKMPISVCMGTACFVRGSEAILKGFEKELSLLPGETTPDGFFSLDSIRCVGACGLAPVVMVGQQVYGRVETSGVKEIIDECMAKEGMEDVK